MYTERVQACASQSARQSKHSFRSHRLILVAIAIFGASLALADPEAKKTLFNIEAQSARTSLTLYAKQAHVQLGFAADIVDDILTNAVKGEYETAQALELLLEGTGLEAEHGESGIVIRLASRRELTSGIKEPAPAIANTNRLHLKQTAQTLSQTPTVPAGNASSDEDDEAVKAREEIVVTGSRIRGAQSASPVVTITRQEIDDAGFATVEEVIDRLPQNFGAGATQDTATDPNNGRAVGGFVANIGMGTSVNLRGLGASSTLILLNGRRMSASGGDASFTDISGIPVTAIERVEVLTDGASAIYGSDAIGGAVNFILRDNYEGAETRLRYGSDGRGDTSNVLVGQSFGNSWDGGNILFAYEYFHHDRLGHADREITSTDDLTRYGGTDWRGIGGNPANISAGGQTFAIPAGQDGTSLTAADFDPNRPPNRYNSRAFSTLLPEQERHSAFLHLSQNVRSVQLFSEARLSTRDYETSSAGALVDIVVSDSNPFFVDPTNTGLTTVTVDNYSLFDDLGPATGSGGADAYGATLGARFEFNDAWDGELAGNWSQEESLQRIGSRFDRTALDDAVNQTDPDLAFNPFGDGSNTNPAVLNTIRASRGPGREVSYAENKLWAVSFNIDGESFNLPGGAVQVATGIEFREESLLSLGDRAAQPPEPGADLSRGVLAVYAELFFPLVRSANSLLGVQRLELSLAGRYEDYSDFGRSTNPKVGLVWSPAQALEVRGTYGTSFKAPQQAFLDVSDLSQNSFLYVPQAIVDLGLIPFPALVLIGGNENLTAEEATTWTAGIRWTPEAVDGLRLDMTYFNIDFDDRIDLPFDNFLVGFSDPRFASLLNTDPTAEQIATIANDRRYEPDWLGGFLSPAADLISGALPVGGILDARRSNLAKSVVTGLELQLSYDFDTVIGSFDTGFNGSYLFDYERQFIAADPLIEEVDTLGRPVDFRARANVTWTMQRLSAAGFVNYVDGYTDNVSDPTKLIDSWTSVDFTVSYDAGDDNGFLSGSRLSLTVQNLFDRGPPFADSFGGLGYDNANHNPLGRFLSFHVTKEW